MEVSASEALAKFYEFRSYVLAEVGVIQEVITGTTLFNFL
jgi:hypothetical protein